MLFYQNYYILYKYILIFKYPKIIPLIKSQKYIPDFHSLCDCFKGFIQILNNIIDVFTSNT